MEGRPFVDRTHSDPLDDRPPSRSAEDPGQEGSADTPRSNSTPDAGPSSAHLPGGGSHSTPTLSRRHSNETPRPRERHRVRFGDGQQDATAIHHPLNIAEAKPKKSNFLQHRSYSGSGSNSEEASGQNSPAVRSPPSAPENPISPPATSSRAGRDVSADVTDEPNPQLFSLNRYSQSKRPATIAALDGKDDDDEEPYDGPNMGDMAAHSARTRAELLSKSLAPNPPERRASLPRVTIDQESQPPSPDMNGRATAIPKDMTPFIPLEDLSHRKWAIDDETESETSDDDHHGPHIGKRIENAARRLLRMPEPEQSKKPEHSKGSRSPDALFRVRAGDSGLRSGHATPEREKMDPNYVERPKHYRQGALGLLLQMYGEEGAGAALSRQQPSLEYYRQQNEARSAASTPPATPGGSPGSSPPSSGNGTPKKKRSKWHRNPSSLTTLIQSSTALSAPGLSTDARPPEAPRQSSSSGPIDKVRSMGRRKSRDHVVEMKIRIEYQELLARYEYMIKSCRVLMRYGAPTHRLEEYMKKSARKLQLDGQFLYMPGCMIISFDSPDTRTTEMKIVRENQGVDLGKLRQIHDIYKAVIHSQTTVQEANKSLDKMMAEKPRYNIYVRIFFYGLASATVGPFGFGARPIDMPVAFVLGAFLGWLQLVLTARSESYLNVFEVSAAVFTSFAARGLGSINGGHTFCFSALAQSAIALILPGFIVLAAALELQSRNIVAGSVRMVYAIIYSLFLGFGITIGVAIYGILDVHATSATTCIPGPLGTSGYWNFLFVPIFTLSLCVVNQAKYSQMPVMLFISIAGYVVNFWSAKRFASNVQVANTLGALAIGILGNLYSRLYQGMSAAAILPAIFVQVPSGIAASGSLISGVVSANQIVNNSTGITTVSNGTQAGSSGIDVNSTVFNVGYTMIQIAVGLTVGLFLSSLLVYPFGKKRSGLFSF